MVHIKMVDFQRSQILLRHGFYLFVLCSALLCGGCSQQQASNVDTGTQNQILHLGNGTEPQELDPHTVIGVQERMISDALFEGLLARNPESLAIEPAVAEKWSVSDDKKIYTFQIRKNARWSNGDPLTAHDFVYSWKRALHPLLGNQNAYVAYPILNAEEYNKSEISDFAQVGVKAQDDYTLVFTMEREWPLFMEELTGSSAYPVHQKTIEKFGKISDRGTAWTRTGNLVSNGPFKLKVWTPYKVISVERNDYYWDKARVKLNGINFYPIDNRTTEERMFRTGQLHMIASLASEKIEDYQQNHPELLHIFPIYATYEFMINTTRPALNDIRVRKALAMSINRDQIVKTITKGGQIPAYSLNPNVPNGYHPISGIEYNIEKAKQLLAEAGFPDGKGFPVFEILYNTDEGHQQIALAVQQMWQTNLNIKTSLVNQEWKVYLDTINQKNYDMARSGGGSTLGDPVDHLESNTTDSGMNRTGWSNLDYDKLVKQAASTSDKNERYRLFQQAEKIITDEVPLIPIYYYTRVKLMSPDIKDWHDNLVEYVSYKDIYLSRD